MEPQDLPVWKIRCRSGTCTVRTADILVPYQDSMVAVWNTVTGGVVSDRLVIAAPGAMVAAPLRAWHHGYDQTNRDAFVFSQPPSQPLRKKIAEADSAKSSHADYSYDVLKWPGHQVPVRPHVYDASVYRVRDELAELKQRRTNIIKLEQQLKRASATQSTVSEATGRRPVQASSIPVYRPDKEEQLVSKFDGWMYPRRPAVAAQTLAKAAQGCADVAAPPPARHQTRPCSAGPAKRPSHADAGYGRYPIRPASAGVSGRPTTCTYPAVLLPSVNLC